MTDIQKRNKFTANLQAELVAIKAFNGILQKEQRTLVNGDVEDLDFSCLRKRKINRATIKPKPTAQSVFILSGVIN